MFLEQKEKNDPPQANGTNSVEERGKFKIRWETKVVFIFLLMIQLIAARALYKNWNKLIKMTDSFNGKVSTLEKLQFNSYLSHFKKTIRHEEYMIRLENFQASLEDIARLNELENKTVFGLTKFSDMSKQEFVDHMLLRPIPGCTYISMDCLNLQTQYKPMTYKIYEDNIPRSFDWRLKGVVKPVLNQRRCDGCWAFGIVGVLESMTAIQLNDSRSRSIQELLDCSPDTKGCYKGSVSGAMKFACRNKLQFVTEEEYPLTLSMTQTCKLPTTGYSGRMVRGFVHNCTMDEDYMVKIIATHGPLIVAVDSTNWQNYIGGIITRACTRGVANHVVQIVGYAGYGGPSEDIPIPYYIVRNSFGKDFGENGYMKIAMNADVCGIAEQVAYMDVM